MRVLDGRPAASTLGESDLGSTPSESTVHETSPSTSNTSTDFSATQSFLLAQSKVSSNAPVLDEPHALEVGLRTGSTLAAVGDKTQQLFGAAVSGFAVKAAWARTAGDTETAEKYDLALSTMMPSYLISVKEPPVEHSRREVARWLVGGYVGTGNDIFLNSVNPYCDDSGFTASLVGGVAAHTKNSKISVDGLYQMITERGGHTRWDQVNCDARYDRRVDKGAARFCFGGGVGLAFGGDAGGADVQNWAHTKSGIMTGQSLYDPDPDKRLQSIYDGKSRFGWTVGAEGAASLDLVKALFGSGKHLPEFDTGLGAQFQVAPGATGLSYAVLSQNNQLVLVLGPFKPTISYSFNLQRFGSNDPGLAGPGGYNIKSWSVNHKLGIGLAIGRKHGFSIKMNIETNRGGSKQGVGTISVGFNLPNW